MRRTNRTTSVIVMTVIGNSPPHWQEMLDDIAAALPGICWRFVPEGPLAEQFRAILRMDACAAVVWVGADDAVDRAATLIGRLLEAGPPTVVAIAEGHNPWIESALRQTGAVYVCANEARQRLGQMLGSLCARC